MVHSIEGKFGQAGEGREGRSVSGQQQPWEGSVNPAKSFAPRGSL